MGGGGGCDCTVGDCGSVGDGGGAGGRTVVVDDGELFGEVVRELSLLGACDESDGLIEYGIVAVCATQRPLTRG